MTTIVYHYYFYRFNRKNPRYLKFNKTINNLRSFKHWYMKYKVGEYYRKKGYWVTFEYKIGDGKTVDLVAEKDGKKIAIEIETGKSDFIYNIRKDLEAGFDEVISIAFNNKIKEKIILQLKESKLDEEERVIILDITDFST